MNKIGILGCGGKIGEKAATILLEKGYTVLGGQRSEPEGLLQWDNFRWEKVDIFNTYQLSHFCNQCTIILNCVGPSGKIKDTVAIAAINAKASYIDAFGDKFVEEGLIEKGLDCSGKVIVSAGSYPGFSGILTMILGRKYFDKVESVLIYSGERGKGSRGAIEDVLISSIKGFGKARASIIDGKLSIDTRQQPLKKYFPNINSNVYLQKYLHNEIMRIALNLQIKNVAWYNIIENEMILEAISKWCKILVINNTDAMLNTAVNELIKVEEKQNSNNTSWFTLIVELEGTKNGNFLRKKCIVTADNSYGISATIAAMATEYALLNSLPQKIFWAYEILSDESIIDVMLKKRIIKKIEIGNIPLNPHNSIFDKMEYGTI